LAHIRAYRAFDLYLQSFLQTTAYSGAYQPKDSITLTSWLTLSFAPSILHSFIGRTRPGYLTYVTPNHPKLSFLVLFAKGKTYSSSPVWILSFTRLSLIIPLVREALMVRDSFMVDGARLPNSGGSPGSYPQ